MSNGKLILAEKQDAIYSWIKNELIGVIDAGSIIWRQQSEALPPRPCVTMKITEGPVSTGFGDNVMYRSSDQKFTIGGQRTMSVSIQVFGNTMVSSPMAYQTGIDLHASLGKPSVLDVLRFAGISVQHRSGVSNLTALEETEYEERSQFDVVLGVAENVVDDPGYIDHVNIQPVIDGESKPPING